MSILAIHRGELMFSSKLYRKNGQFLVGDQNSYTCPFGLMIPLNELGIGLLAYMRNGMSAMTLRRMSVARAVVLGKGNSIIDISVARGANDIYDAQAVVYPYSPYDSLYFTAEVDVGNMVAVAMGEPEPLDAVEKIMPNIVRWDGTPMIRTSADSIFDEVDAGEAGKYKKEFQEYRNPDYKP